jgi:hypothetical protein
MGEHHNVAVLDERLTGEKADYLAAYESDQREADYERAMPECKFIWASLLRNLQTGERRLYDDYRDRVAAATGDLEVLAARSGWAEAHDALTAGHEAAMAKQWLHLGVTDRFESFAEWSACDMDERRRRVRAV